MDKKTLKLIFSKSVNPENSNAFQSLGFLLKKYAKSNKDKIKVITLAKVLDELSEKWKKEIDEYIGF